ncbi:MAG: hypothetical protein A2538_05245 [Candidatus Magasanikbacteria bacterium RIFOXYD2_FULL_41_14]|uniref:3D domain-containing protein n=1 Tax=Candidatus Magasanikbacteria bacterium RIFOXYD2_FULL_41_14 TaxID=1798709 RepID=A0A1F6PBQ9_9BACT|nr:MAG: hypothetical protein A2538_05245 [Candidatus Magasanikbacteria bacterium RIFOXYD2_FULL_41_14]
MLNKPKNSNSHPSLAINLAVLSVLLSQVVNPMTVLADSSRKNQDNEVFLTQTQADRMFYPNTTKKADLTVRAVITAYTSTIDQTDDDPFIAASGKRVYDGMIAANGLPMGTMVKIPALFGDKVFRVDDRMNRRYAFGRFDIWMDATRAQARQFGVKRVEVEIYYLDRAPALLALAR